MNKGNDKRRAGKAKAPKRDLSARTARTVVGGLLPAQPARGVSALAQAPSTREIEQRFNYEKFKYE